MVARFMANRLALFGAVIVTALIVTALLAPHISPFNPVEMDLAQGLKAPDGVHVFGMDKLGRDIFSRVIYGSRISLWVGIITVSVSALIGIAIGSLAGYCGGAVDEAVMRIIDVMLAFPGILLAIALMAIRGPGLNNVILALCVMGWVGYARLVRAQILSIREREFVMAAVSLGAGPFRVVFRHMLPNLTAPLMVEATFGMAGAILAEAGLSFLGLGTQPPTPSWGTMLNEGREFLLIAPHMTTFPGLAIALVVLGFNFLGDGLRDVLDPVRKGRSTTL